MMTNNSDNNTCVTIENVREANAAVIRIEGRVRHAADDVDRHPDDDEKWQTWRHIADEMWQVRKKAAEIRFHYWRRTGVVVFAGEVT